MWNSKSPRLQVMEDESIEIYEHLLDGSISEKIGHLSGVTSHDSISLEIRIGSTVEGEWGIRVMLESNLPISLAQSAWIKVHS